MRAARPLVAGLTGNFGSGKSTVAGLFAGFGARVVDADQLAHEALEPASPVFQAVQNEFPGAVSADGAGFNRKMLASLIFNDAVNRSRLEAIIHPYVFHRMEEEIKKAPEALVILEIPLLFETGYHLQCDKTIFVEAAPDTIAGRLKKKGFSQQEIQQRIAAQMSAGEKKERADFAICNNETIEKTREEVRRIFHQLLSERKGA